MMNCRHATVRATFLWRPTSFHDRPSATLREVVHERLEEIDAAGAEARAMKII